MNVIGFIADMPITTTTITKLGDRGIYLYDSPLLLSM